MSDNQILIPKSINLTKEIKEKHKLDSVTGKSTQSLHEILSSYDDSSDDSEEMVNESEQRYQSEELSNNARTPSSDEILSCPVLRHEKHSCLH